MAKSCIFCEICKGKIKSHKVYEDKYVFAFLDIHPINPGHILVIPKNHISDFYKMKDALYSKVMLVVKKLAKKINVKMNPKKVGLIVAGWDVNHTHIHIVPMKNYHDITSKSLIEGKRANPSNAVLERVAKKLNNKFEYS